VIRKIKRRILRATQSSTLATSALFFADGLWARLFGSSPETTEHLAGVNFDDDLRYARTVADYYLAGGPVRGKVAEVGPGGSAAVALNLVAQGAQSVALLDRFSFGHDGSRLDALYRRFDNYADLRKISFHSGEDAAAERFFDQHRGFDGIFSCAVLEHVYDPQGALRAMVAALNPGGRMVHQVDLSDHGMFTEAGKHELTFLTIPDGLYRVMSESRGRPNRVTVDVYRDLLDASPVDYRLLVTHLVGCGELPEPMPFEAIRAEQRERAVRTVGTILPRLAKRFRAKAVDDLAVSGFRIEATKRS